MSSLAAMIQLISNHVLKSLRVLLNQIIIKCSVFSHFILHSDVSRNECESFVQLNYVS